MKTLVTAGVRKRRTLIVLALSALALSAAAGSQAATGTPTALPQACKLLTRAEAQALVGTRLQRPNNLGRGCMYTGYPTGPTAQVELYVDSSLPRTLQIDRGVLHHKFRKVPGLGDQALEEEWTIFVRKGAVWITIHVVRLEAWPLYRKRLEQAARIAISRIRPATRRAAGLRSTAGVAKDPPASGGRERWVGRERRFGGSITRYAGVVYQPDVVLIGGGANAIRSESPDGLTWTIDAHAPGASDLRIGKIMLATTFAAGRVLKLTHVGPNVQAVIGPAALTDIIRDGTFDSNGPIALARPIVYKTTLPKKAPKARRTQDASSVTGGSGAFTTTPLCCTNGLGVRLGYQNGAGRLSASVWLYVKQPTVNFRIRIAGGRLLEASVELHGVGGLRYEIHAATKNSSGDFRSGPTSVPGSLTIPLAGPLGITLTQSFDVSMQLAGAASLDSSGDYAVTGMFGFGFGSGSAKPQDLHMQTRKPITESTVSLGVGENALSLGWKLRATVGIGAVGFSAGAWYAIDSGLAVVADGSHLNSLKFGCVTAAINVRSQFGVGYTIPDYARSVINAFLGALGAKPIPATGGPSWGPFTIWNMPGTQWCPPRK
jgi:hypothetical protein